MTATSGQGPLPITNDQIYSAYPGYPLGCDSCYEIQRMQAGPDSVNTHPVYSTSRPARYVEGHLRGADGAFNTREI